MSKYKSQGVGQTKRSTNMFYRSGISSLLSRLEKLENEVFCDNCKNPIREIDGTETISRTHNGGTIFWTGDADGESLRLWPGKKGDRLTVVLSADAHGSGGDITVANSDGYFWGLVTVRDTDADDKVASQKVTQAAAEAAPGSYDFIRLEDDATDTGGSAGDILEFICVKDNGWYVRAELGTTGTPSSIAAITSASR